jgi:hypothetical protein
MVTTEHRVVEQYYGLDPISTLWFGLALTAVLILVTWLACRAWYLRNAEDDAKLLDAIWEIGDALDWPGELGERLERVLNTDEPGSYTPQHRSDTDHR